MKTKIKNRKTPHAISANLFGGKSTDTIWAWAFETGDVNDRLIKKYIPKSNVYVAPYTQDLPDNQFKKVNLRNWHVDVWNEKCKNLDVYGKFMVNYQIRELLERSDLRHFLENE